MGIRVEYFDSVDLLRKHVEIELESARELYSFLNNKIEKTRSLIQGGSEPSRKGSSGSSLRSGRQDEIAGFRILSNPSPEYELNILDEALLATQRRVDALKRVKDELLPKLNRASRVTTIYEDDVPIAFMHYDG